MTDFKTEDFLRLSTLRENLVSFHASRTNTSLIWCSDSVADPEKLSLECSYIIGSSSTAEKKFFYAERYGGSGIQRNGGGARCGFDGRYQVKGIGANPLVGEGTDGRHSNGSLGAVHAVYEMLWSEGLARILPYGAVRTLAVLLSNEYTEHAYEHNCNLSQRALLVREPVVRPAHFERAPYFCPQTRYSSQLISDAERIEHVIKRLPENLPVPAEGFSLKARSDLSLLCVEGMCELARRQALQTAFCRTRFLRLTTSPSNIAMDGRLMDFNGLNSLFPDDYCAGFDHQLRLSELIKEPLALLKGLYDLSIYLGKYLFSREFSVHLQQEIKAVFDETFSQACYRGYLSMLGVMPEMLPFEALPPVLIKLADNISQLCIAPYGYQNLSDNRASRLSAVQSIVTLVRASQKIRTEHHKGAEQDPRFLDMLNNMSASHQFLYQKADRRYIRVLDRMADIACLRLQSRKRLNKTEMFGRIACLLDEQRDAPAQLRLTLSQLNQDVQRYMVSILSDFQPDAYLQMEGK